MVGMRWWIEHNENGKEKWVFETKGDSSKLDVSDIRIFWIS